MADGNGVAVATAAMEMSKAYLLKTHKKWAETDMTNTSLLGVRYQLKRAQVEFDKYMNAITVAIAHAENKEAKDALLVAMAEVEDVHAELHVMFGEEVAHQEPPQNDNTFMAPPPPNGPRKAPENLADFNGTHENWPAFIDVGYSELESFLLLRKHCKGPAEEIVTGYSPVAASFKSAWDALKDVFEDSYSITQSLVDKLFDLPATKNRSVAEMRRVIDTVRSTLRQLKTMGATVDRWDPMVMNLLARKAPTNMVQEWEQNRNKNEQPSLDELLTFLDGKARLRHFVSEFQGNRRRDGQPSTNVNGTASNLLTQSTTPPGASNAEDNPFDCQSQAKSTHNQRANSIRHGNYTNAQTTRRL